MTADQELDRVVAWLRREADRCEGLSKIEAYGLRSRAEHHRDAFTLRSYARRLARHEHRSEADG